MIQLWRLLGGLFGAGRAAREVRRRNGHVYDARANYIFSSCPADRKQLIRIDIGCIMHSVLAFHHSIS